jgi:hypothetical protein
MTKNIRDSTKRFDVTANGEAERLNMASELALAAFAIPMFSGRCPHPIEAKVMALSSRRYPLTGGLPCCCCFL